MKISLLADCPHEAARIAQWYFDEWGGPEPDSSVEDITTLILNGANRTEVPLAFVVHLDGELSGAGEIKYRNHKDYPEWHYWLDGIYVPSPHRGKGISTVLIEFAKTKAEQLGLADLYLRCESHNLGLYENRGFQTVRKDGDKLIMAWSHLRHPG